MISKIKKIFLILLLFYLLPNIILAGTVSKDYYIELANNSLKNMTTYQANFIQTTAGENTGEGMLYINTSIKKMMWVYLKPMKIDLLISKKKVTYFDKEINEVSYTSVDSGLFTLFTDDNLGFNKNIDILDVELFDNNYAVKVKNINNKDQREDEINLIFRMQDNLLVALDYFSKDGNKVSLKFNNIVVDQPIDKKHFRINKSFLGKN